MRPRLKPQTAPTNTASRLRKAASWATETCVEAGQRHTPLPLGYVEQAEDAEQRLGEGQVQALCPTCHRWAVWLLPSGERAPGSGP